MLFLASLTGISVSRDNNDVSALSWVGSRCCTSTNAIPVRDGNSFNSCVVASNPPADAPIPTMGKGGVGRGSSLPAGAGLARASFVPLALLSFFPLTNDV